MIAKLVLALVSLFLLVRWHAQTIIVLTVVYLERFLRFFNANVLVNVGVAPGVSLNIKDLLIFYCIFLFIFTARRRFVSRPLRLMVLYLGFFTVILTLMSILIYDASLGVVGDRLRFYFNYALILGLVMFVEGRRRINFLLVLIFGLGTLACGIHFIEYMLGKPIFIPGLGVTAKHVTTGAGMFEGVVRLWNRAPSVTLVMFSLSLAFLGSNVKNKMIYIMPFLFSLGSIAVSLTRTMYIYVVVSFFAMFFMSAIRKEGRPIFMWVLLIATSIIGPIYIMNQHPEVIYAVTERFYTIISMYTEGIEGTTMSARAEQFAFLTRQLAEAPFPPVFGLGVTDESAQLFTSDLGYMNIIINMGVAGLLFVFFVWIYLFSRARYLLNNSHDDLHKAMGMGILCMLPGLILIGYNFDYLTGHVFLLLALPVVLLEAGIYAIAQDEGRAET